MKLKRFVVSVAKPGSSKERFMPITVMASNKGAAIDAAKTVLVKAMEIDSSVDIRFTSKVAEITPKVGETVKVG